MKQQRNTKQRQLVLEAVRSRSDHPTADQIYFDVRTQDNRISRGTVYRNLNVLVDRNEVTHVKVPTADRYDLRLDKHYHLFCICCGAVWDAPLTYQDEYDQQIETETGFHVERHRTIFEGICAECQKKPPKKEDKIQDENELQDDL